VVEKVNPVVDEVAKDFTFEFCDDDEFVEDKDIIPPYQATTMLWRPMNRSNKTSSWIFIPLVEECPLGCAWLAMFVIKINHPQTKIKSESSKDLLLLLKEWEQLCASYSLLKSNT
ncbi:hypothetical protein H5410_046097, partial [Solanum commersonii]